MTAILEMKGLGFSYGSRVVLDGLSLAVEEGEMMGLVGANGAGKTTLLRLVSGVLKPREGRVELAG